MDFSRIISTFQIKFSLLACTPWCICTCITLLSDSIIFKTNIPLSCKEKFSDIFLHFFRGSCFEHKFSNSVNHFRNALIHLMINQRQFIASAILQKGMQFVAFCYTVCPEVIQSRMMRAGPIDLQRLTARYLVVFQNTSLCHYVSTFTRW
jgi:hypothetical protein